MKEIVAKRYAKALIRIGQEDGQYELYGEEIKAFRELLAASSELREVMENPIYDKEQKKTLFQALNAKLGFSQIVINFILLLIEKRRVVFFNDIVRFYEKLSDELAGKVRAEVRSAVSLPKASMKAIEKKLAAMTGKQVLISSSVDPELIGGVVTKIGDVIYDGSIRTQLYGIKETLMKG